MLNTSIAFILLNEKAFFYYILTIELLLKYQKKFLTVVHIGIHNVGNNVDIHRSLKVPQYLIISFYSKDINTFNELVIKNTFVKR